MNNNFLSLEPVKQLLNDLKGEKGKCNIILSIFEDFSIYKEIVSQITDQIKENYSFYYFDYSKSNNLSLPKFSIDKKSEKPACIFAYGLEQLKFDNFDKYQTAITLLNMHREDIELSGNSLILWITPQIYADLMESAPDFLDINTSVVEFFLSDKIKLTLDQIEEFDEMIKQPDLPEHLLKNYQKSKRIQIQNLIEIKKEQHEYKYDVFISYASEDNEKVKKIADELKKRGVNIWFDEVDLIPGHNIDVSINYGLANSRKILAIWTKNYFRNDKIYTKIEAFSVQHEDIINSQSPLIPLLFEKIEKCNIPPTLRNIKYIDFCDDENFYVSFQYLINNLDLKLDNFYDDVCELFKIMGFNISKHTKLLNDIKIIEYKLGNHTISKGILGCYDNEISINDSKNLLATCNKLNKELSNFNEISTISNQIYECFIVYLKNDSYPGLRYLKQHGAKCYSYIELLNELMPFEEYARVVIEDFKKWRDDCWWGREDLFVQPKLSIEKNIEKSLDFYGKWLGSDRKKFLILLGDLGIGKTTFTRYISNKLAIEFKGNPYRNPAPVYIQLKKEMSYWSIEEIISNHFKKYNLDIQFERFKFMLKKRKIILILDAFDEMAIHIINRVREKFYELIPGNKIDGKIILTCRTHFFRSLKEERKIFNNDDNNLSIVYMKEFDDDQVDSFIKKFTRYDKKKQEKIHKIIQKIYNLKGFTRRPLLLQMIISSLKELEQALSPNVITIYDRYTNIWIDRQETRSIVNTKQKRILMHIISWLLWNDKKDSISYKELEDYIKNNSEKSFKNLIDNNFEDVLRDTMTASFLRREEDSFKFMHNSFMEYFLAQRLYHITKAYHTDNKLETIEKMLQTKRFEQKIIYFLALMDREKNQLLKPLQSILEKKYIRDTSENALQILYWKARYDCDMEEEITKPEELQKLTKDYFPESIELISAQLENIDLSAAYLAEAKFIRANLEKASFKNAIFEGVSFNSANLTNANFFETKIKNTNFEETNLKNTIFHYAKFTNCEFTGAKDHDKKNFKYSLGLNYQIDILSKKMLKPVIQQRGHCGRVEVSTVTSDKVYSASGGADGLILIYKYNDLRILWALEGHTGSINALQFSNNNKMLISGSADKTVRLWDVVNGEIYKIYRDHTKSISCVCFSNNSKLFASGSFDRTVRVWNIDNEEFQSCFKDFKNIITHAYFSSDDNFLFAVDIDNNLYKLDINKDTLLKIHDNNKLEIVDSNTDKRLDNLHGHAAGINSITFSRKSPYIASANMNKTIRVWDIEKGVIKCFLKGHEDQVTAVRFSTDGRTLFSCSYDNTVRLWDIDTERQLHIVKEHQNRINAISYSTEKNYLASASNDKTIIIWDIITREVITCLKGHDHWVASVDFSTDGNFLASGSYDRTVKIWDIENKKEIYTLNGHNDWISAVTFSSDGKLLISGSMDNTIIIWDAVTGNKVEVLTDHKDGIRCLDFQYEKKILASGSRDNTIRLWDMNNNGKCIAKLEGNMGEVKTLKFSLNKRFLVSAGDAGRLQFWDYENERIIMYQYCFEKDAWLTLLPDGRFYTNNKGIKYLGYTEQGSLEFKRASELKDTFYNQDAIADRLSFYI